MDTDISFGQWVRRRRKSLDLTQTELAELVRCSVAAIQKIERDERRPSRQIAALLAEMLQIPPEQQAVFIKFARYEKSLQKIEPFIPQSVSDSSQSPSKAQLPLPSSPLVGREGESEELQRLLREPACRLLTITGEAGIGKTRLCLELAWQAASPAWQKDLFQSGVVFVPLASISSPEYVYSAVAEAAGLPFAPNPDNRIQFFHFFQGKNLLLVLDNAEHLLNDPQGELVEFISNLLANTSGVKLLITSRERLKLLVEWTFELTGLPYPQPDTTQPALAGQESLEDFSAVALFVQCARRRDLQFRLTPENRKAVICICQLVDGMPLGIELAASWVTTLTVDEIAREIEQDLDFLSARTRDAPERHRSIRAAFDHSWRLLSPGEQAALRKLSVFQGGFTRQAAKEVAGADLAELSGLIEKSLLRHSRTGRYDFHELVKQYCNTRLDTDAEERRQTYAQHSACYLAWMEQHLTGLRACQQKEHLAEITNEIDNLRRAWEWAVDQHELSNLHKAAFPLMAYHELRDLFPEGEAILRQGRTMVQELASTNPAQMREIDLVLAELTAQEAWFTFRLGRTGEALAQFRQAVALIKKNGDDALLGDVLWYQAFGCLFGGQFEEALHCIDEGLQINRRLNRAWQVAISTMIRGGVLHEIGRYEEAHSQLREALVLCRATGDPRIISTTISFLSRTKQVLKSYEGLQAILQEELQLSTEIGDRYGIGLAYEQLASAAWSTGDGEAACEYFHQSIGLFQEIGDLWSESRAYNHLAKVYYSAGNMTAARESYIAGWRAAYSGQALANAMDALAGLAAIFEQHKDRVTASRLAAFILHQSSSSKEAVDRAKQLLKDQQNRLSPRVFDKIFSAPQSLEEVNAILAALHDAP